MIFYFVFASVITSVQFNRSGR